MHPRDAYSRLGHRRRDCARGEHCGASRGPSGSRRTGRPPSPGVRGLAHDGRGSFGRVARALSCRHGCQPARSALAARARTRRRAPSRSRPPSCSRGVSISPKSCRLRSRRRAPSSFDSAIRVRSFNRAPRRRPRERCRRTRRGSDRERRGHALPPAQVARRTLTAQPPQFRARRRTIPLTSLRSELAIGMMDHEPADAYPRGATWLQCNERG